MTLREKLGLTFIVVGAAALVIYFSARIDELTRRIDRHGRTFADCQVRPFTGTGTFEIVSKSDSVQDLCSIVISLASPADFALVSGTGNDCEVSTGSVTGIYKNIQSFWLDENDTPSIRIPARVALCLNSPNGVQIAGVVRYREERDSKGRKP